jgi:hypothetical protein
LLEAALPAEFADASRFAIGARPGEKYMISTILPGVLALARKGFTMSDSGMGEISITSYFQGLWSRSRSLGRKAADAPEMSSSVSRSTISQVLSKLTRISTPDRSFPLETRES